MSLSSSILLVEDNKINQKLACLMLGKIGVQPVVAESGRQAIEAVRNEGKFDLILMDLHMPGMDGVQAAREIRGILGDACPPIVALTADVFSGAEEEAMEKGLDGYLTKPVTSDTLAECIRKYTGN